MSTSPAARAASATATAANFEVDDITQVRNISIIAHIDAGKTTCTERILHLADRPQQSARASSRAPGEVDHGSTVTDFLEAERERGITIQSAAVGPIFWKPTVGSLNPCVPEAKPTRAAITLVDTPGHIDFTIEVERAVRVADGSVVILDGVEGVEAQTQGVWSQATRYGVKSHILFVNKLDRMGASLRKSVLSFVQKGLHSRPVLLQLPVFVERDNETELTGLIDLLTLELLTFSGPGGQRVTTQSISPEHHMFSESLKARKALIEAVAGLDEPLLEAALESDALEVEDNDTSAISDHQLRAALRRQTISGAAVPVLCGAAAKNIGVQPLLDAIANFLPSPRDVPAVSATLSQSKANLPGKKSVSASEDIATPAANASRTVSLSDPFLSALAFKVVWNQQMGAQTFVRLYSGTLQRSSGLFNTGTQKKERLSKILLAYADQYIEVERLRAGQIGVILGLQDTRTGDTLVDDKQGASVKQFDLKGLHLPSITVPPPVFSMSIEAQGKSDEAPLKEALDMLVRTDPSLRLDDESVSGKETGSGQSTLSGMGELHLDIAKGRLRDEFKVRASLGDIRVSYREALAPGTRIKVEEELDRIVGGRMLKAGCTVEIECQSEDGEDVSTSNTIDFLETTTPSDANGTAKEEGAVQEAPLRSGAAAALSRGPLSGSPVVNVSVRLSDVKSYGPELTTPAALTTVASRAVRSAFRQASMQLLEPHMDVTVECDHDHVGKVASDLTNEQQGEIVEVLQGDAMDELGGVEENGEVYLPPASQDEGQSTASTGHLKASIRARAPLSALVAYSSRLRALTAGSGTFTMAFSGFKPVHGNRRQTILAALGR